MATTFQVTFDSADPAALAAFWAEAVHYVLAPPPKGFDSWDAALDAWGVPTDHRNDRSALVDPEGVGPRIFFQKVPEPKTVKNRVHVDLLAGGGPSVPLDEQRGRVAAQVARLESLGATRVDDHADLGVHWAVMRDPEGNEF
ncbi:MAG: VOC family protein, partial [Lapillicoccus sp.]